MVRQLLQLIPQKQTHKNRTHHKRIFAYDVSNIFWIVKVDIVAVGVKPTISGYEPDELGLLAISTSLLYHILDNFSIVNI